MSWEPRGESPVAGQILVAGTPHYDAVDALQYDSINYTWNRRQHDALMGKPGGGHTAEYIRSVGGTSISSTPIKKKEKKMRIQDHEIKIKALDSGFDIAVGCKKLAIETPEKLVKLLGEYLKDPEKTAKKLGIDIGGGDNECVQAEQTPTADPLIPLQGRNK